MNMSLAIVDFPPENKPSEQASYFHFDHAEQGRRGSRTWKNIASANIVVLCVLVATNRNSNCQEIYSPASNGVVATLLWSNYTTSLHTHAKP